MNETPKLLSPESIIGVIFIVLIWMAVGAWSKFRNLRSAGLPLEEFRARAPVPWGLIDLFVVAVIYVGLQSLALTLSLGSGIGAEGVEELDLNEQLPLMVAFSVASLLTLVAGLIFVGRRTGATLEDFGLSPSQWSSDTRTGVTMFSLLIVPIFALQWVLQLFSSEPSHPLVKMLMESSTPAFFLVSAFVAVIVAPLVEEFLFRVLLQGWLENLTIIYNRDGHVLDDKARQRLIVGGRRPAEESELAQWEEPAQSVEMADEPTESTPQYIETADVNPYLAAAALESGNEANENTVAADELRRQGLGGPIRPSWWPIVVSAIVFALAHFGHGTDPIPLFFFALGLGWLYQRTHRMWPSVLVHMMLNGLSMVQLFLYLQIEHP